MQLTNTGVRYQDLEASDKELPCLTVCPWGGFKQPGFHFRPEEFIQQTFERDEILGNIPNLIDYHPSKFDIESIPSIFLGRCYMICYKLRVKEKKTVLMTFNRTRDLTGV